MGGFPEKRIVVTTQIGAKSLEQVGGFGKGGTWPRTTLERARHCLANDVKKLLGREIACR